jgi:hypothetical protein
MANTIIELRRSNVSGNVPSNLANGEIAINTYDGKLFYRGGVSNTIQTIERFQGPAGLNQEIQFNDSGVLGANSGLSFNKSSGIFSTKLISVTNSTGDEGGEILLAKPSTNTTLVGTGITIDAFQNKIRFFEQGGSARGAYIDLTECVGGAGTNLLNPTSTPDTIARNTANAAFIQANAAFTAANSAGVYANGAFAAANAATATNLTQNNSITAAFAAANAATATDLTQNNSITSAFTAANSAGVYANGAFARANNSLNANTGGTVTGDLTIGTGTGGVIAGANVIYSNVFVANSGGYVQFADGSRQFTANAGSGGGGTSNSFATISNTATALVANTSNTRLTIVGESGIVVAMNSSINQITIAAQPGAQGLTVDYGFVAEPVFYALDYGTL